MKTKLLLGTMFVLTGIFVVSARADQGNAKINSNGSGHTVVSTYPVQVVFRDASTDTVTSDGLGMYVDGQSGVTAELQLNPATGRIGLHTQFAKSRGVSRHINVAYLQPVVTACNPTTSSNPTGTTTISSIGVGFGIQNLGSMAIGSTLATQGEVNAASIGFEFKDPTIADGDVCSDLIVANRSSATSWTVTTDAPLPSYVDANKTQVFSSNPEEVGSTAQGSNSTGFLGNYRIAYLVTITCLQANTAQQPNNCPNPQ